MLLPGAVAICLLPPSALTHPNSARHGLSAFADSAMGSLEGTCGGLGGLGHPGRQRWHEGSFSSRSISAGATVRRLPIRITEYTKNAANLRKRNRCRRELYLIFPSSRPNFGRILRLCYHRKGPVRLVLGHPPRRRPHHEPRSLLDVQPSSFPAYSLPSNRSPLSVL